MNLKCYAREHVYFCTQYSKYIFQVAAENFQSNILRKFILQQLL